MNEEVLNIIANEYLYGTYCVNERMIENIHLFIQLLMKEWLKHTIMYPTGKECWFNTVA